MAAERTLARPYAEAVFDLAQDRGQLVQWSEALTTLTAIVCNDDVAALIGNPGVDDKELAEAIISIAGDALDEHGKNLVKLLADNGRLEVLPAINEQYAHQRALAENRVDVEVTAAIEINDEQQQQLSKSLKRRLNRDISLTFATDPTLIGGAVVRAGDLVIDGSVRAQLSRMQQALAH